jgi:hypothetical protein
MLNPAWVLWPLAVVMVAATGGLIRWAAQARTPLRAGTVVFLLLMMVAMFAGAAIYFVSPSAATLVEGFWVASAIMSVSAFTVFAAHTYELRARLAGGTLRPPPALVRVRTFVASVIALVLANELLMGWTFQRAAGGPVWLGGGGLVALLEHVLVSPWFVFPMALEMALTLALLGGEFPPPMRWLLAFQPLVMLASPPTVPGDVWVLATATLMSAGMAAALGYLLRRLYRGDAVSPATLAYAARLFVTFGLMAGGLAWWAVSGQLGLFALGVIAQMLVYFEAIVRPLRFAAETARSNTSESVPGPLAAGAPSWRR